MRIIFLDLEVKDTTDRRKKRNPSPYIPTNFIVSYGWRTQGYEEDTRGYHFLRHSGFNGNAAYAVRHLQSLLDQAELVVAFNAKFELSWLLEAGFRYEGPLFDPMVCEYIIARGVNVPLDLDSCCARRQTIRKLGTLVEQYWDDGLTFYEIPLEIVQEYGLRDVDCLYELYNAQQELLALEDNQGLLPTISMSNEFIKCLVEMERNGIFIDDKSLEEVREEFTNEYRKLRQDLEEIAQSVMGDTKINLDSPEQLSWLIYSRKVNDKHEWAKIFNIGTDARGKALRRPFMSASAFVDAVRRHTSVIQQTRAVHCMACGGRGFLDRLTKSGQPYKRKPRCRECDARGYILENTGKIAGFRLAPTSIHDVSSGGFATDKQTLASLVQRCKANSLGLTAKSFLTKSIRYNAIGSYLSTFVEGIALGRREDGILHTQLMQCITSTGRLSSQQPNFQNMPRGMTFPVRRVVRSRWEGGEILEVDFAQLEYRVAVYLAQDKNGMKDIAEKVDAHSRTASIIECDRQTAKPHTFKPLYGGQSGTEKEQKYYKWFKEHHADITTWQQRNIQTVLSTGILALPSGREYAFPGTRRTISGYVTNTTQICNYPVQGFATADIVPVTIIEVLHALRKRGLRSLLILTVHDSICFDVFPGEREHLVGLINDVFTDLPAILKRYYGIAINVPLDWEIKCGHNWMNMKGVH